MKGVRLSVSPFFFYPPGLLCLRSSRSKYNASTINCFFFSSTLRPKINPQKMGMSVGGGGALGWRWK